MCSANGFLGGGQQNGLTGITSVLAGGFFNKVSASSCSFVGGGSSHCLNTATSVFLGGGASNCISFSSCSFLGGGLSNTICTPYGTIVGGVSNKMCTTTSAYGSVIVGGVGNNTIGGTWTPSTASLTGFVSLLSSDYIFIGGGLQNGVTGSTSSIVGGRNNIVGGACSFIGGGSGNTVNASFSAILAGSGNTISSTGTTSFIVGANITSDRSCGHDVSLMCIHTHLHHICTVVSLY